MVIVEDRPTAVALPAPAASPAATAGTALCTMSATEAAVPALRRFARTAGHHWSVPADTLDALSLVVTELVTNAVLHSGSPDVTVLLVRHGPALTVEVKDCGQWRVRAARRRVPEDAGAACGRGLDLVKRLTTAWLAHLSPAGTCVVATLSLAD
ncbi:ATP-binding protein [Kitasatospora sp. NPDC058965]|uniref:ATP-binding protein n=1 Tax=Kitasatospora sp. NPDC058965 TaxID=3346682 RepID=UPI0036B63553